MHVQLFGIVHGEKEIEEKKKVNDMWINLYRLSYLKCWPGYSDSIANLAHEKVR